MNYNLLSSSLELQDFSKWLFICLKTVLKEFKKDLIFKTIYIIIRLNYKIIQVIKRIDLMRKIFEFEWWIKMWILNSLN